MFPETYKRFMAARFRQERKHHSYVEITKSQREQGCNIWFLLKTLVVVFLFCWDFLFIYFFFYMLLTVDT